MEEVIIIGAGPCGLSAAVELQRKQFNPLVIEKHCMAYSIYRYPTNLQFFSSPELLEIGGIPFSTPNDKPYRQEALVYYRNVASHENIRIHSYEEVVSIVKKDYGFDLHTIKRGRKKESIRPKMWSFPQAILIIRVCLVSPRKSWIKLLIITKRPILTQE